MSSVTVLGATGGLGHTRVAELAARGHGVAAANRRGDAIVGPGVRRVAVDASDTEQTRKACADSDVVVMAATVPYSQWAATRVPMVANALDAAAFAGARLVTVDCL